MDYNVDYEDLKVNEVEKCEEISSSAMQTCENQVCDNVFALEDFICHI